MIRDLTNETQGTPTPWRLSDFSETGEALIFGECDDELKMRPTCIVPLTRLEGDDIARVHLDARRIVAAVNLTRNLSLQTLESLSAFSSSSDEESGMKEMEKELEKAIEQRDAASREAAYYFPDED